MNHEIFNGPNMAVVGISMVFVALAILVAVVSAIAHQLSRRSNAVPGERAAVATDTGATPHARSDDTETLRRVAVATYAYHLQHRVTVRRHVAPTPWRYAGRQRVMNRLHAGS